MKSGMGGNLAVGAAARSRPAAASHGPKRWCAEATAPLLERMTKVQAEMGRKKERRPGGGGGKAARAEMDVGEEARQRRLDEEGGCGTASARTWRGGQREEVATRGGGDQRKGTGGLQACSGKGGGDEP